MGTIRKALRSYLGNETVKKASRGTLSTYTIGVSPEWGQPLPLLASGDAQGLITPERMREIVMKTPTASACMNAILDYSGGVEILIRENDPDRLLPKYQKKEIARLFSNPNPQQTSRQFRLMLYKDLVTYGFAAVEIERTVAGGVAALWVLDSGRLKIDFDEHGKILGYDMLDARGNPILEPGSQHGWGPEDIIYFSLNPMSTSMYPYSRISQLFSSAVVEDMMMYFIASRFTDSNIPFGIMDLGDITEQELKIATSNWNAQSQEQHRILLTGSKGGSKWIPFGYHLKDLEATGLLAEVRGKIMAVLGVTMNELGESQDVNKSNGYNLSFTFKKRAIEPLLNEVTETLTKRLLWETLGYRNAELYYQEIDSRDDLIQAQIDDSYAKMGVISIDDIRNRRGDTGVEPGGGDVNYIFTGNSWIPVSMISEMAEAMVQAEKAGAMMSGPDGSTSARISTGTQQNSNSASGTKKPQGVAHAASAATGSK